MMCVRTRKRKQVCVEGGGGTLLFCTLICQSIEQYEANATKCKNPNIFPRVLQGLCLLSPSLLHLTHTFCHVLGVLVSTLSYPPPSPNFKKLSFPFVQCSCFTCPPSLPSPYTSLCAECSRFNCRHRHSTHPHPLKKKKKKGQLNSLFLLPSVRVLTFPPLHSRTLFSLC